jgi:hypothetical protein
MTNYPISEDSFVYEMVKLYELCNFGRRERTAPMYYEDFGNKYTTEEVRKGFKRLRDKPPKKLDAYTLEDSIKQCQTIKVKVKKIGCTYCDTMGLIPYYKEINNRRYSFVARCHVCKTSEYINEPFYNEVFPDDDIQPHSTPEQMVCGKHIVEDVVRVITKREHDDPGVERKREHTMYGERER